MASVSNPPLDGAAQQPATAAPAITAYCPRCGKEALGAQFCSSCGTDLGLSAAPVAPTAAVAPRAVPWGGILIVAGGALAVLGSFLPWLSVTAPLLGNVTRSGLDGGGDGIITLVIGAVLALLGVALILRSGSARRAVIGTVLTSLVLGVVAVMDIGDVQTRGILMETSLATEGNMFADAVAFSVGMGLYVILIGGVLGIVGSVVALRAARARATN